MVFLRVWEKEQIYQMANMAIALFLGVDLFILSNPNKFRPEMFDILGFLLPNMYLLLNPSLRFPSSELLF
jgi:hypothetical protein